jgi:hypothetical protein
MTADTHEGPSIASGSQLCVLGGVCLVLVVWVSGVVLGTCSAKLRASSGVARPEEAHVPGTIEPGSQHFCRGNPSKVQLCWSLALGHRFLFE